MRAPLSIVIPTLDAEALLPPVLTALMEGVEAGLLRELVFSDGGSTDETKALAEAVGARFVSGAPDRAGQIARGVAASSGDWLLLLDPATVPLYGWVEASGAAIARATPGGFRLRARGGRADRLAAGWANLRLRYLARPSPAHPLLLPRAGWQSPGRLTLLGAAAEIGPAR